MLWSASFPPTFTTVAFLALCLSLFSSSSSSSSPSLKFWATGGYEGLKWGAYTSLASRRPNRSKADHLTVGRPSFPSTISSLPSPRSRCLFPSQLNSPICSLNKCDVLAANQNPAQNWILDQSYVFSNSQNVFLTYTHTPQCLWLLPKRSALSFKHTSSPSFFFFSFSGSKMKYKPYQEIHAYRGKMKEQELQMHTGKKTKKKKTQVNIPLLLLPAVLQTLCIARTQIYISHMGT